MDRRIQRSRQQEHRTAKKHNGRRQSGSGSSWSKKGDVKTKRFLIENKRTDAKSISIKAEVLEKIWTEAWADGLMPALVFELGGRSWIIHAEDDYLELEREMKAEYEEAHPEALGTEAGVAQ